MIFYEHIYSVKLLCLQYEKVQEMRFLRNENESGVEP